MPTNSNKQKKARKGISFTRSIAHGCVAVKKRIQGFMARRPHRSFRLTRRRDYVRPLALPGYVRFTNEVHGTVWKYRRAFLPLLVLYVVLYGVLVGLASQETYGALSDSVKESADTYATEGWELATQTGALFVTVATSGLSETLTEAQQIFAVILTLMIWLTVVWYLRNKFAGHAVKLRDALYSSGSPLFASLIVVFVLLIQLIPIALAAIGYAAASTSGLLNGGVEAMLFWMAAGLLGILSLFWVSSSLFALVIVTLPGMYPFKALKSAGDIVLGRRIKLLLRIVWMLLTIVIAWALLLIPIILLDMWLKSLWTQIAWLPIVPIAVLLIGAVTVLWSSVYIYLLYRKVVDYGTE